MQCSTHAVILPEWQRHGNLTHLLQAVCLVHTSSLQCTSSLQLQSIRRLELRRQLELLLTFQLLQGRQRGMMMVPPSPSLQKRNALCLSCLGGLSR